MSKSDLIKQLQIKTSSIKRMIKDLEMYKKEEEEFKLRIEKMKNDGNDIHDIQQQEKCLHETLLVYRDVLRRLSLTYSDLHKYLRDNFDENIAEISNSSNNSKLNNEDQIFKLVSTAYNEMKRVQVEYGDVIKLESLDFVRSNQDSNVNDDYI